jgi:uncharacterized protein YjdB
MKKSLLVLLLLIVVFTQSFSQIKINEVQSSNTKTIKDSDFQEYVDWIELYNPGTSSVNIGGYYLTDDKDEPRKWQIPTGTSIAAKGYLLIWCDGKNINRHTNYKLGSDGERIVLYSNTMLFQDSIKFPEIATDFTYGRTVNGAGEWALLTAPTPGATNVSTVVKGLAPKPTFNIQGGFYTSNQSVTLSTTIPGAVIRYTTDGSEPTASSPIYTGAITAQKTTKTTQKYGNNRLNKTGIQKYGWPSSLTYPTGYYDGTREYGFVIKAKVFHPDYLPSYTAGQTYFINMRKPTLPVVSITTDFNNFFSADTGIYIQGTNGISNGYVTANWYQDWERKGHIEYFDATGSRKFGVSVGISTSGAVSRSYDLKSLNIVMRNKYETGTMEYQLFGSDGLSSYKSIMLRNSGNDWEMGNFARDAIIQSILRGQVDLETQDYQPVVMYLNGEYWGLINMRERYDENLFAGYHSYAEVGDIDLLKIDADKKTYEANEGDTVRYKEMMAFVNANNLAVQANYDIMRTKYVDVDNMINYYIAQIYCQNTDWPANNTRMWRPRRENGKFRFPLYDTDFGYGLWGGDAYSNNLSRVMSTTADYAWSTVLFRKMMDNADFKNEFIQRYAYMINTVYSTTRLNTIANNIENTIKTERDTYNDAEWTRSVNSAYNTASMISWGTTRIDQARSHINSQFGSKGWQTLTVNYTASQGSVTLCGLPVTAGYSGQQYANTPIRMNAIPADGYRFVRWENGSGTSLSTDQQYYLTITAAYTIKAVFEARPTVTNLKINEIMASNATVYANDYGKYNDWIEIYNAGTSAVDLAGLYISDDVANPTKYKIPYGSPEKTTIPAGGYKILWANGDNYGGVLYLPFKLNKDGGIICISQKSSTGTVTTIDNITYGSQITDLSYGCYPDGNANKIIFTAPTPGASNTVQSATFIDGLKITEFMAKNASTIKEETGTYADWFEIHNTNATSVDIGGLFVTNDLTNLNMYMIPKGQPSLTTIPAGGYLILWADKQIKINPNHVDFKLNAEKGDIAIVQLRGASNYIIDQVSYTNQGEDISYGRFPSVTSNFRYLAKPTPGAVNNNTITIPQKTGITINEILAWNTSTVQDETGSYADYIEFYNAGTTAVDLGGLFVSDSAGYSLKYRIPRNNSSATTVQPGQWITFWADGDSKQGPLHLDFNLNQAGEDVVLSQVTENGLVQLDLKSFGAQTANVSFGRFPETATYWETMSPTYNAKNQSANSSTALKTLTSSAGILTPTLSASVYEYVCILPAGTTAVPTISATTLNANASKTITQAANISGTAKVTVISANGLYTQDYLITFSTAPSPDASLKTLTISSGTLSPAFSSNTYNYTATLSSARIPLVTAVANNPNALVEVVYATNTTQNTVITVTAESGAKQVYTIAHSYSNPSQTIYSWSDNFDDNLATDFTVTGTSATYYTITAQNQEILVSQAAGKTAYRTFIYNLPSGYLLDMLNNSNPILTFSVRSAKAVDIRVDLRDADGNVGSTNIVTKSVAAGASTTLTYDYTGKNTNIDKSRVVALVFYTDPDITVNEAKQIYIDNITLGIALSNNANLATLTASAGTLSPTFNANTTSYTLTLPAGTTTIPTISATKAQTNATLEISQPNNLSGTAIVRVTAQDNVTVKTYTVQLVQTPQTVLGFTDHIIKPGMPGWTENSSLYSLQYLGGEIAVSYYRTAAGGSDAITYNITDAEAKILNLTANPYVAIRLKTTVQTDLRVDLFDNNGYVTNSSPVIKSANGNTYVDYIFNFSEKFSQTSPTQTVASNNIRGIKMYFDNGSTTPKSGTITIDKLIFGNEVVIPVNNPPVISTIPNQSIMQGETFNNVLLNNYVTDDSTPVTSLIWSVNTSTNFNVTITNNVATIVPKNSAWIGSETLTFTVQDLDGATASKTATFTVTELKIPVENVLFTQTSVNVAQNATIDLSGYLSITPTNATIQTITWTESSANASINTAGVLTNSLQWGTEAVTVTVTVTDKNSNTFTKTITVNLTGCPTQLTSVSLLPATVSVVEGQTIQLTPTYTPANACIKTVTYSSSATSVATVSASGLVTGIAPGTAIITISVNDGFTTKTATKTVTVTKDCSGAIVMSISQSSVSLIAGTNTTLSVSFSPNNECTQNKVITWTSSNTNVATVTNGIVTGIAPGTATITASTDGTGTTTQTCVVTVTPNCYNGTPTILLDKTLVTMFSDQTSTITASVSPLDVCNSQVTWSSSANSIATVSNGVITAVSPGTATVTCSSLQTPVGSATVSVTIVERMPSSITLPSSVSVLIGNTQTLAATILPATAYNKTVTWSSSNTSVATVSATGVVNALSVGVATITATTVNGLTATCMVTVSPVLETSVSLNKTTTSMYVYDTDVLIATVLPENTTDKSIVWTSSNSSVVSVLNGTITAIKAGSATITATTVNGLTATCVVTVQNIVPTSISTSITGTVSRYIGSSETVHVSYLPTNITDSSLTWTSSDASIVNVSQQGVISAVGLGTATITVTSVNNKTAAFTVQVNPIVATSISLNTNAVTLTTGNTQQLIATIEPLNTTNKTVVWTSSATSIAQVNSNGLITAVNQGNAIITATTSNGLTATCNVTVELVSIPVSSVALNKKTLSIQLSQTETLVATVMPLDATNKTIVWSSSNSSIATVSQSGIITPVAVGQTNIIATASNGKADTCVVTILHNPISTIGFSQTTVNVSEGATVNLFQLLVTQPSNAFIQSVVWSELSSNASISAQGVLTNSLQYGVETVTVTATITDAYGTQFIKTIDVVLHGCAVELSSVTVSPSTVSIVENQTLQLIPLYSPANACIMSVSYASNSVHIATVSASGLVSAVAPGTAIITITVNDGFTTKTVTKEITVLRDCSGPIVLSLPATMQIVYGQSATLTPTFTPNNECTANKNITWTSSNPAVASVNNGVITTNAIGTTTITASTDGTGTTSATCTITVVSDCNAGNVLLQLNTNTITMYKNETNLITTTITPTNACNINIVWQSNNESVATVVNGLVTAIGIGSAIITATSEQTPSQVKTVSVQVIERLPSSISMPSTATVFVGNTLQLTPSILPANADNKSITWTSSNTAIATVSASGIISGINAGTVTITATTVNNLSAQCIVTVSTIPVESVTLNKEQHSVQVYEQFELQATVLPSYASNKQLAWTSSDVSVATVSNGIVTAIKAGTAVIRASSINNMYDECIVTVTDIYPTSLNLTVNLPSMNVGTVQTIEVSYSPANATNTSFIWSSNNSSVITVNQLGQITAISPGTATITASTATGVSKSITITVNAVQATSLQLNTNTATLKELENQQLIAIILPENTTNKTIAWTSSNPSVATVDNTGKVTALAVGTAEITATTSNGIQATCVVNVVLFTIPVSSIQLNKESTSILLGNTEQLIATIAPENATNKTVVWKSETTSIATVSQSGLVTSVGVGAVRIIATASNGMADTCIVYVQPIMAQSITIDQTNISMTVGGTLQVSATILPANTTNKSVTWLTSNSNIVSVSEQGLLTAKATGVVTLYAQTYNGLIATREITVENNEIEIQSIALPSNIEIDIDESIVLQPQFTPTNATNTSLTWTVGNNQIALVNALGKVTGISAGTTIVTATSSNNKQVSVIVSVKPLEAEEVQIIPSAVSLHIQETAQLQVSVLPIKTTDKSVTWTSSNPSVATVNQGIVTAKTIGQTTVYAITKNGKVGECIVHVVPVEAEAVQISISDVAIMVSQTYQLTAQILPSNVSNTSIQWSSSNQSIVSVDNTGKITANATGKAYIYATANNGLKDSVEVTVSILNYAPEITPIPEQKIRVGQTFTAINLQNYVTDDNTDVNSLLWAANTSGVLSMNITSKGIATIYNSNPLWIGSQTITIYCTDEQGLQSSVDIIFTVEPKVHIETISILSVQAYPNPAKDNVRISFTVAEPELYTITIVSMSGNIVMQQREWVANQYSHVFDVSLLPRGMYMIQIATEEEQKIVPMILY